MLSRMPVVFADNILTKNNSQLTTLAHSGVTYGQGGGAKIGDKCTSATNLCKMEGGAYNRRGRNVE